MLAIETIAIRNKQRLKHTKQNSVERLSEAGAFSVLNRRRQIIIGGSFLGAEVLPPDYYQSR